MNENIVSTTDTVDSEIFASILFSQIALKDIWVCFVLILNVPSTIFQLNRDGSSWVEPVLS